MIPNLTLTNGHTIPQIGLGLWQVKTEKDFKVAVNTALKNGYRHFDTAQAYGNEKFLGSALSHAAFKREEIFITTKIHIAHFSSSKLHDSFEQSLKDLQTDYVDLLLLHFPVTILRKNAWLALEDIKTSGLAKNIGVSNYTIRHLEEMKDYAHEMPVINQVEMHVFLQQPELRKYCHANKIQVEAYSPLGRANIMDNPVILRIADKHSRTYAQIMLRFLIQLGLVVIPKSVNPTRIKENIDIFDFELDKADMKALGGEDQNRRFCWSPVHVP
jgi:diketogulonate reductase-like aldo/keto reductase